MTRKEAYIQFCEREKEVPIFSQPWYLDMICGQHNWDILLVKRGDTIAATMPYRLKKKFSFSVSRMPPLTKYWGPYFAQEFRTDKQQQKSMSSLAQQLPPFDFFEQNFHPELTNWLPFYWEEFSSSIFYTYRIDLAFDLEVIYKKIHPDYRNNKIPKAENTIQISTENTLENFYDIQQKTFSRKNLSIPFSFDFLNRYDTVIKNKAARKMFFALDQDENIHAAIYLIWDEHTCYFHLSGDDISFRDSASGIYLTWHAIKFAKEVLQKKWFDFEGSMLESVARVRQNFGASQTPYINIRKYNSKLLKILHRIKRQ